MYTINVENIKTQTFRKRLIIATFILFFIGIAFCIASIVIGSIIMDCTPYINIWCVTIGIVSIMYLVSMLVGLTCAFYEMKGATKIMSLITTVLMTIVLIVDVMGIPMIIQHVIVCKSFSMILIGYPIFMIIMGMCWVYSCAAINGEAEKKREGNTSNV